MNGETWFWVLVGAMGVGFGLLVAFGASGAALVLMIAIGILLVSALGRTMRREADASWLATWVTLGFLAKMAGTFARYYMVMYLYGVGDSLRYYSVGVDLARIWRNGDIPSLTGSGSLGTQMVEATTGALFAIATPSLLGGFVLFAMISYLGQLGFYAAFRRWAQPHQLKPYAFFILFLPTYAFWPSSIGKDALVILFLGVGAYFVSRLLESFEFRWVLPVGVCLVALGLIRIHIAALVAVALLGTVVVSKLRIGAGMSTRARKFLTLGVSVVTVMFALTLIPDIVGLELNDPDDILPFTEEISRRTSEDGTVAAGNPVQSIVDVPGAIVLVLFRPFVFEAREIQQLLAAAETGLILLLSVWKLPAVVRNWRQWRRNAYLVYCTLYTVAFAVTFSVVRNLGILSRQRGQVLAFFLALIIGLGWEESKRSKRAREHTEILAHEPEPLGIALHQ